MVRVHFRNRLQRPPHAMEKTKSREDRQAKVGDDRVIGSFVHALALVPARFCSRSSVPRYNSRSVFEEAALCVAEINSSCTVIVENDKLAPLVPFLKSGRRLPHSKSCRMLQPFRNWRSVFDCGSPMPPSTSAKGFRIPISVSYSCSDDRSFSP